jgi:hypothetical protein
MSNFDLKKYLAEGKLFEENSSPSEEMHQTMLSYIKPEFRDSYPKNYDKYFIFLKSKSKPTTGSNKPDVWIKFLKDLIKNNVVSLDSLNNFSEKYNDGGKGIEGLAGYLYKQGTPSFLQKIDNLK